MLKSKIQKSFLAGATAVGTLMPITAFAGSKLEDSGAMLGFVDLMHIGTTFVVILLMFFAADRALQHLKNKKKAGAEEEKENK